ncbi:MAG TPA: hypothetical protein DCE56_17000 [Cyanobacteria bacterium UBA8553]|nr:hypothetical protein [Cyanobacteria bacterium UBA8553]
MKHQQLVAKVAVEAPDVEYIVYPAGLKEKFPLGEKDVAGLHLTDATAEGVLNFIKARKASQSANA